MAPGRALPEMLGSSYLAIPCEPLDFLHPGILGASCGVQPPVKGEYNLARTSAVQVAREARMVVTPGKSELAALRETRT